jgi:hypothetical protein
MSRCPAGTYLAVTPEREPAAPDTARPFEDEDEDPAAAAPLADPAAGAPAADGAAAAAPNAAAEEELAVPEQPVRAAIRITLGTAAATSRRRREARAENDAARAENEEHEEREERARTACLVRMPLGRRRYAARLRRQVTIRPHTAR